MLGSAARAGSPSYALSLLWCGWFWCGCCIVSSHFPLSPFLTFSYLIAPGCVASLPPPDFSVFVTQLLMAPHGHSLVWFVRTLWFLVDFSEGRNQNNLVGFFFLATGQLNAWESAQPGHSAVERWKGGEGRDVQCGAQQPGIVRERELCVGGSVSLRRGIGCSGAPC